MKTKLPPVFPHTRDDWTHFWLLTSLALVASMTAKEMPVAIASGSRESFGPWYDGIMECAWISLLWASKRAWRSHPALSICGYAIGLVHFLYLMRPQF